MKEWCQYFTYITSRSQVAMQNLPINIREDLLIKPLVLSLSIIFDIETAKDCCESLLLIIEKGDKRLKRYTYVIVVNYL